MYITNPATPTGSGFEGKRCRSLLSKVSEFAIIGVGVCYHVLRLKKAPIFSKKCPYLYFFITIFYSITVTQIYFVVLTKISST